MVNKIDWGVLGAAGIAVGMVIPAIQQSKRGRVVALGSRDAVKAKAAAQSHGIDRVHGSCEAVLADPQVEAIYVLLPNLMRAPWRETEGGFHASVPPADAPGPGTAGLRHDRRN